MNVARRSALAWVLAVGMVTAGCAGDDDDTLTPLPIEGGTVGPLTATTPVPAAVTTLAAGSGGAGGVAPTTTPITATPTTAPAVGDWDGARFDVGTIQALTRAGAAQAISFDRWSYTRPDGSTVDATALDAEPLVAWWSTSPFTNRRVQARTFVLAPDVEVLVLDPSGKAAACAVPPPATSPTPTWIESDLSALQDPAAATSMVTLSYSPAGEVTRIRLTSGC